MNPTVRRTQTALSFLEVNPDRDFAVSFSPPLVEAIGGNEAAAPRDEMLLEERTDQTEALWDSQGDYTA
jgi:hypothetical protein